MPAKHSPKMTQVDIIGVKNTRYFVSFLKFGLAVLLGRQVAFKYM